MSIVEVKTSTNSIEFQNVGPIEHLTIPIPEEGGLVVLRGQNGSGKSHALAGVESLYSPSVRKSLRNSDGVPSGKIEGLGVTVRLGRSNTAKGELLCESLDGRVDPSHLVDPGLKDPTAADARRLATLVRLSGIKVSLSQWQSLAAELADEIDLIAFVDADPVATADRLRRRIHEVALNRERLAESKANEAAAMTKSFADVDLRGEHNQGELARRLDSATQELAKMQQTRVFAQEAVAKAEEARKLLAEHESTACAPDEFAQRITELEADIASTNETLAEAEQQVRFLRNELDMQKRSLAANKDWLAAAMQQQSQLSSWHLTISRSESVACPSDDAIAALETVKAEALKAAQQGEVIRRAIESANKASAIRDEADQLAAMAVKLRALARSTDTVLEQALVDAGYSTIKVHDGRLCVESDRGLEPFSELSHGERWRMALDLAARGLPKGAVLPVCQEAFESLDPANREFVNALAKERGLVIVTAEACGGDLRAEVY